MSSFLNRGSVMRYAVLVGKGLRNGTSNGWKNIGDYVQSLAGAQYLPQIDEYFDRENPCATGENIKMIMNAWYMWNPDRFPICKRIIPLPVSMHISPMIKDDVFKNSSVIDWFKKNEPIGCRDKGTESLLKSKGIDCYFSGCLTLTLGKKYKFNGERKGLVFVDPYIASVRKELSFIETLSSVFLGLLHAKTLSKILRKFNHHYFIGHFGWLKRFIYSSIFIKTYCKWFSLRELADAEFISHMVKVGEGTELQTEGQKMAYAENLVKKYARASLVVTGRIHCALPCLGIETPVIFTVGHALEEGSESSSAGRFGGLIDFFNVARIKKLKASGDFEFPVKNKDFYKPYAEELDKKCTVFMQEAAND